jgi:predicted transcriptional regulator
MTEKPSPKTAVHFRIDQDLADLVDRDAQRLRLSRSDIVRQAIIARYERKDRAVA